MYYIYYIYYFYPKNIYAIAIAAMIPARSANRPQVTA